MDKTLFQQDQAQLKALKEEKEEILERYEAVATRASHAKKRKLDAKEKIKELLQALLRAKNLMNGEYKLYADGRENALEETRNSYLQIKTEHHKAQDHHRQLREAHRALQKERDEISLEVRHVQKKIDKLTRKIHHDYFSDHKKPKH